MKWKRCFLLLVSVIALFGWEVRGQKDDAVDDNHCYNFDSACYLCIQEPSCQWCTSTTNGTLSGHKCFSANRNDIGDFCENGIENPQNSNITNIENKRLSGPNGRNNNNGPKENIIQLRPQHIQMKLRRGVPQNLTVSYRRAKDYPLDLYYLMDFSHSMRTHKDKLAEAGRTLAATLRNLTSDFKIGFGSFVDKVMLPFVNTHPQSLKKLCNGCVPPFSFKNDLQLTERDSLFEKKVKAAKLSQNLDSPEGGFDALMQVMMCTEDIGWRDNVQKIIVFSTDATFHSAGDGKLAGVLTPNDGECHLNKQTGMYDDYDKYDYPSVGQLNDVATKKGINIIFAVERQKTLYNDLAERIKGSSRVELGDQSTNLVSLIVDVYNKIAQRVELEVKNVKGGQSRTKVRFFTNCGVSWKPLEEKNVCNDVTGHTRINFEVEITVLECPELGEEDSQRETIEIGTSQQDILKIDVDLLCHCDCENRTQEDHPIKSKECHDQGTKLCGVCYCEQGHFGQSCQCSKDSINSAAENDLSKCRRKGVADQDEPLCSGRGRCECETCICSNKERHHGRYCECDRARCHHHANLGIECSDNGMCRCNECECNNGWEGDFCECRTKQACNPKDGGEMCSGNGECICGRCDCQVPFTGRYCEDCPTCGAGKCLDFRNCVQCKVWGTGQLSGQACDTNCSSEKYNHIHSLKSLDDELKIGSLLCTVEDQDNGCDFNFTYKYIIGQGYRISSQDEQVCPEKVNLFKVIFSVIGGIVGIDVITLIVWKILTTIHDQKENKKFLLETKDPKWETSYNKSYDNPTSTVTNPAFSGST